MKKKVKLYITKNQANKPEEQDDVWTYCEARNFEEKKLPEHWSRYRDKLIQEAIDNTEEDYFTDILDNRIAEVEYYEDIMSEGNKE